MWHGHSCQDSVDQKSRNMPNRQRAERNKSSGHLSTLLYLSP